MPFLFPYESSPFCGAFRAVSPVHLRLSAAGATLSAVSGQILNGAAFRPVIIISIFATLSTYYFRVNLFLNYYNVNLSTVAYLLESA